MEEIICCPICKSKFDFTLSNLLICEYNHHFDMAKEGYFNLLPVQKKKSLVPGDNAEMITARRSFLEEGHYDPLVKKLKVIVGEVENGENVKLDIGCGEGYYTEKVFENEKGIRIGFDISKTGIRLAAKKYKDTFYFVGGIHDIPVLDNCVDIALSVFTPISVSEFSRVLKSKGLLIVASAGENHLKEIAELIYDEFKPHSYDPYNKLKGGFEKGITYSKQFIINVDNEKTLINLLKMTPYYWKVNDVILTKMLNKLPLSVTCDFAISTFFRVDALSK